MIPELLFWQFRLTKNVPPSEPFAKARKFSFPVFFDDGKHKILDIPPIPAMLIIDPSGNIRIKNTGFNEGDNIEEKLNKLVEEFRAPKQP